MDKDESKDSYGHVLKYTGIFGGVQGLNIIIGLVRNKITALLLGPAGMGLASLLNSAVNFISQATNLGISFSAIKHISELYDQGDTAEMKRFIKIVRAWSLVAALLGMIVCIAAGPLLNNLSFSWGDHTLHFIMLSPAVALMAITGGETAILKATRKLKALAVVQLWSVAASLLISVPLYWLFGWAGIVPVIILMALASMIITVAYSYRMYPLRLCGAKGLLGEGMEMVRLGVAFIMSGIMTSGAEMLLRALLNAEADLDIVGLYNAGFMLTVTYSGMVFSAMETDYFPRLSAANHDNQAMKTIANRQIEVSLLIVAPMLTLLITALPLVIPMLYSHKFSPVVPMAQIAAMSMYFRAITLPIAYMTLAKSHSKAFFVLETISAAAQVAGVLGGYHLMGLTGTGAGLLFSYIFELIIIYAYAHTRYAYRPSKNVCIYVAIHLPLGIAAYLSTLINCTLLSVVFGLLLTAASTAASLFILHKKTSLWNSIKSRINKFRRR